MRGGECGSVAVPPAVDGREWGRGSMRRQTCAAAGKEQTTESDQAGQCWLDHSAFSNNDGNISRIECETNENEHLIR